MARAGIAKGWKLAACSGALAGAAGIFLWWWKPGKAVDAGHHRPAVEHPVTVPDLKLARAALTAYFEAPDDAAKLAWLYDRDRVAPLWGDYYGRRRKAFPLLERMDDGRLASMDGATLASFRVNLEPGGVKAIALRWDGRGFLLDWESSVAYGTMDWAEWVESKPADSQLMRVFLSRLPPGRESVSGLRTVVVDHPDGLSPVPAVIPREVAFPVDFEGRKRVPVTAEFRFREGTMEMTRFLYEGWSR